MRDIKKILEYIHSPEFKDFLQLSKTNRSWLPFNAGYVPPAPKEIEATFLPFHMRSICELLGYLSSTPLKRIYNGVGEIEYAKWRLFLIATGRVAAVPGQ